jgi:hypothetical protein
MKNRLIHGVLLSSDVNSFAVCSLVNVTVTGMAPVSVEPLTTTHVFTRLNLPTTENSHR